MYFEVIKYLKNFNKWKEKKAQNLSFLVPSSEEKWFVQSQIK